MVLSFTIWSVHTFDYFAVYKGSVETKKWKGVIFATEALVPCVGIYRFTLDQQTASNLLILPCNIAGHKVTKRDGRRRNCTGQFQPEQISQISTLNLSRK